MNRQKNRFPDWDTPSEGNEELCRMFSLEMWRGGDLLLPYRLFCPKRPEITEGHSRDAESTSYPFVVYLHGADAVGVDNKTHLLMHDIGTVFAREDWQKHHPCYILAPQYTSGMHWTKPDMQQTLLSLIDHLFNKLDHIDRSRVYIYGYSAGGMGTLELLKCTDLFAGAIVICGAAYHRDLDQMIRTPIWLFHAADDRIVSASRSPGFGVEYLGSAALYKLMKEKAKDRLFYTEYPPGKMKEKYGLNPHCAWVPAGEDEAAKEWLFRQRKKDGKYVGEEIDKPPDLDL